MTTVQSKVLSPYCWFPVTGIVQFSWFKHIWFLVCPYMDRNLYMKEAWLMTDALNAVMHVQCSYMTRALLIKMF